MQLWDNNDNKNGYDIETEFKLKTAQWAKEHCEAGSKGYIILVSEKNGLWEFNNYENCTLEKKKECVFVSN